jgi:Ecdysteroid kinase-like family
MTRLINRLIYQSNEPAPVIVLEDAKVDGYFVIDKPPQDFEVSKMIIERLAKFHAATYFMADDRVSQIFFKLVVSSTPESVLETRLF